MQKILVIGATCVDVILNVPSLPAVGGDASVTGREVRVGGCAYNVYSMLRHFGAEATLCSPVCEGEFSNVVRERFKTEGIPIFAEVHGSENGCCYCIVDSFGERTFLCNPGGEYIFHKDAFDSVDKNDVRSAYICGLELEYSTGGDEVSYIEELSAFRKERNLPFTLFVSPSPRLLYIKEDLLFRLFNLSPVVHLNKKEALSYAKCTSVTEAIEKIYSLTSNAVIVTLGGDGTIFCDKDGSIDTCSSKKIKALDSVGAGDGHLGSVIANLSMGKSLRESISIANIIAAKIVGVKGSTLSREEFSECFS